MARALRVLIVTAALVLTGAALGAAAAVVAVATVGVVIPRFGRLASEEIFIVSGAGLLTGALLAPLLGWTLLRRTPLGRAISGPVLGTTFGGILGAAVPSGPSYFSYGVVGALIGSLAGAYLVRTPTPAATSMGTSESRGAAV